MMKWSEQTLEEKIETLRWNSEIHAKLGVIQIIIIVIIGIACILWL